MAQAGVALSVGQVCTCQVFSRGYCDEPYAKTPNPRAHYRGPEVNHGRWVLAAVDRRATRQDGIDLCETCTRRRGQNGRIIQPRRRTCKGPPMVGYPRSTEWRIVILLNERCRSSCLTISGDRAHWLYVQEYFQRGGRNGSAYNNRDVHVPDHLLDEAAVRLFGQWRDLPGASEKP